MSLSAYRDIWKRLAQTSVPWRKVAAAPKETIPLPDALKQAPSFPSLDLSVPTDFTAFLVPLPLSPSTLQRVLSKIDQAIQEQKVIHEGKYQELCAKFIRLNLPSTSARHQSYCEGIKKTYESSFQRHLSEIRESVVKVYQQIGLEPSLKKAAFNVEYTPVLEQYFEYNAYPSARDRELLARKSSMTPRQIEVWFQNHRRRARREGRHLKRMATDPLPAELSLDMLKGQVPAFMLCQQRRGSPSSDEKIQDIAAAPTRPLPTPASTPGFAPIPPPLTTPEFSLDNIRPPPCAWPAAGSPRDGATLFATSHAFQFEAPVWSRKSSSFPSPRPSPCLSAHDLCSDFRSKLHLGGAALTRRQRCCKYTAHPVATRQRYVIELHPFPSPLAKRPPHGRVSGNAVEFGHTSSLRSRHRHQPYSLASRRYPSWSLDTPKPNSTPSRPDTSHHKPSSSIPRTPSLSSISSSGSSYSSDPPTPWDSPYSSSTLALPEVIGNLDGGAVHDLHSLDPSTGIVTSSYPSSTERYSSYPRRLHSPSLSRPSPNSRLAAH
uniref:Mating-type homeodomain protein n=1 Tax=Coprinellus disseminatus TaxID=71703 RepID=Q1WMS2_COPDI|nr:mating-type homeodomain protein [Coprinellus disseminatus]